MPLNLPGWANKLEHTHVLKFLWQLVRPLGNRIRREVSGCGPLPFSKPHCLLDQVSGPVMIAVSPSIIPTPADWQGRARLTGYWFLDQPDAWQPPPALSAFLDGGTPPVYIGFGSMTLDDPQPTLDVIVGAVERVGCRAVISAGWAGLKPQSFSPDICAVDDVPHDWLFSRAASIVHHGGAGTTAAALRAGKPSVVVPFFSDQPFWGRWLVRLGAGVTPIPRRQLNAEKLAHAIARTLTEEPCQQAAARLGEQIRSEDGVSRASEMVEAAVQRRPMRPALPLSIRPAHVEA
jgi:UDP:flavonoid glycosyltransferase YjiC (YdhE family)